MNFIQEVLEPLTGRHPELKDSGFAHAANISAVEGESRYEFGNGICIRKAQPNEIVTLQTLVQITRPTVLMMPTRNPYESLSVEVATTPGSRSVSYSDLPAEEWRYHVITFEGQNDKLHEFLDASALTRTRIHAGPTVLASEFLSGVGFVGSPSLGFLWEDLSRTDDLFVTLKVEDLDDLRQVYSKYLSYDITHFDLRNAVKRFAQLDSIPIGSPLRFLGYISILESIITHAPDPKDPYDSLTRQVRQKMLLISRRCQLMIPYEFFGPQTNSGKLWTKLYAYRSKIAHGASPDFSGDLQCLKDAKTALRFLTSATTSVLRQALEEPELIADLRNC